MPGDRGDQEKRWAILQVVQQRGRASVAELSEQFAVSEVSVRRYLEQLQQAGLLRRVHGGAQALGHSGQISVFEARLLHKTETKQELARAAASLIKPSDVVFLDSGTSVLEIARRVLQIPALLDGSLTIVTRSLSIAAELRGQRRIRLIVVGGLYVHDFDDFVGPQVQQTLHEIHADILFMGTDGVSTERGLTTDNVLEAGLYQDMARCAERVVVVTDSSKIGIIKVQTTLPFTEVHTFITDQGAPADFVSALQERGCEVLLVPQTRS